MDIDPLWWMLLAVVVLAALVAWALIARNKRLEEARKPRQERNGGRLWHTISHSPSASQEMTHRRRE